MPISVHPETPSSSHSTSYRSMRTSVSKRDSRGESPLVSSPLTASEQGGMNVSPLLTSAAAGALAKRKVARAEDLSKLTIKPSELDIMVSPPTPGKSMCLSNIHVTCMRQLTVVVYPSPRLCADSSKFDMLSQQNMPYPPHVLVCIILLMQCTVHVPPLPHTPLAYNF